MNIFLVQRWLAPLFFKKLEQRGKPTLDLKTKIINEPIKRQFYGKNYGYKRNNFGKAFYNFLENYKYNIQDIIEI